MSADVRWSVPHRRLLLASLVLALGCAGTAQADSPAAANKSQQAKAEPSPEARARALLERQLKALPADNAAFAATFAKDAGVFVPNFPVRLDDPSADVGGQIAGMNPHAEMKSARLVKLVAGGNASMAWLAAEITITVVSAEPEEKPVTETHAIRAVELMDAAQGWKVVAASFTEARPIEQLGPTRGPIPSPTAPGPLVALLASPDGLARSLGPDPVAVYGTDAAERALGGAAAKALLAKWRKLPLAVEESAKVREVRTAAWGYAMAIVNIPKPGDVPYRMSAFLIAVPDPGGAWSVIAASYGAL